jgi:hypothetical protein
MTNCLISLAIARQQERPDIHRKVVKVKQGSSFDESIPKMIHDLYLNVPGISSRQLSTLVGVTKTTVLKHLANLPDRDDEQDNWTTDNNESQATAELGALTATGCSGYTDQTDFASPSLVDGAEPDIDEPVTGIPQFLSAPAFSDTHRRADQSHTVKRPITLATTPFNVAA